MGPRHQSAHCGKLLETRRRRCRARRLREIDTVLGIGAKTETEVPAEIVALAEARTAAKKAKDFKRADAIREEFKAKGWAIEDTAKGPKLKKL